MKRKNRTKLGEYLNYYGKEKIDDISPIEPLSDEYIQHLKENKELIKSGKYVWGQFLDKTKHDESRSRKNKSYSSSVFENPKIGHPHLPYSFEKYNQLLNSFIKQSPKSSFYTHAETGLIINKTHLLRLLFKLNNNKSESLLKERANLLFSDELYSIRKSKNTFFYIRTNIDFLFNKIQAIDDYIVNSIGNKMKQEVKLKFLDYKLYPHKIKSNFWYIIRTFFNGLVKSQPPILDSLNAAEPSFIEFYQDLLNKRNDIVLNNASYILDYEILQTLESTIALNITTEFPDMESIVNQIIQEQRLIRENEIKMESTLESILNSTIEKVDTDKIILQGSQEALELGESTENKSIKIKFFRKDQPNQQNIARFIRGELDDKPSKILKLSERQISNKIGEFIKKKIL